ncbi:MAG: hypothetical protein Q4B48_00015 [Syntrophomonadaceae bacterium]|nr:hypothetical protein [Syntrophomonadaceae bacterium]
MSEKRKGTVISREEFINSGAIVKEHYEGLLVASDRAKSAYDIGIQINDEQVMLVDSASPQDIRHRILNWAPLVAQYQRQYGK